MKSVILDDSGKTLDGRYKLVLVEPTTDFKESMARTGALEMWSAESVSSLVELPALAAAVYRAMVAESPAPELGEAVLSHYVNNDNGEVIPAEDFYDLPVSVWTPLFTAPPAPAMPAEWRDELLLIQAVLDGYPVSMARADAMRAVKALLQSPAALIVERLEGTSIQARLSADANVLIEDGYIMRAANIKEAIERIALIAGMKIAAEWIRDNSKHATVWVEDPNGHPEKMLAWVAKERKLEPIKCAICEHVATEVDSLHPYHQTYDRCAAHTNER